MFDIVVDDNDEDDENDNDAAAANLQHVVVENHFVQ